MKLIADSGSTKTEWRLTGPGEIRSFRGKGLNPVFLSKDEMIKELESLDVRNSNDSPAEIHFYAAGVATEEARQRVLESFRSVFGSRPVIFVNDDLIAASRALFGKSDGISAILGTGSNSCLYKAGEIRDKIPALGYILGDEGSGTDIGKRFINAMLKKEFSAETRKLISLRHEFNMADILENTYRKPMANRYLAGLTRIVKEYENIGEVRNLVKTAFTSFIHKNLRKYENYKSYPVGFAGSVAFHFQDILTEALQEEGLRLTKVLEHPIDELVKFHQKD